MPKPKGIPQKPRKPNGDYARRDVLQRLYDEWLMRDFGAQTAGIRSSAEDCRVERTIIRDAIAEILRLRGRTDAADICAEYGPSVALEVLLGTNH